MDRLFEKNTLAYLFIIIRWAVYLHYCLEQGLADYNLWAKYSPLPDFANKVLLEPIL